MEENYRPCETPLHQSCSQKGTCRILNSFLVRFLDPLLRKGSSWMPNLKQIFFYVVASPVIHSLSRSLSPPLPKVLTHLSLALLYSHLTKIICDALAITNPIYDAVILKIHTNNNMVTNQYISILIINETTRK
jgi:hypothetical protein